MKPRGAAAAGAILLLGFAGCVYYNALYNAERLFAEGEVHRRAGRDSVAAERYAEVIRKAAGGFRRQPAGEWADDALLLIGRAYLRRGDVREARSSLEACARLAGSETVRLQALLHLGEAYVAAGERATGLRLLNEALPALPPGPLRAEGHLWRARVLLEEGEADMGWWDLEQASGDRQIRTEAALARVAWGVRLDSRERAGEGMTRLLGFGEASDRADTVVALARAAARRWGPGEAALLLQGYDTARWEPSARGKVRLQRALLLREAGDTSGAEALVRRVASGFGPAAADARLELAAWHLARARDLVEARYVLPILLPAVNTPRVARRVERLRSMIALAEHGFSEPLAWFAAGEVAREDLGAPALARGLFLAYADAAPEDPWVAKALLAALGVSGDEEDRAWLLQRLEANSASPYVLAARGEPALGLEALEEELARRLDSMRMR